MIAPIYDEVIRTFLKKHDLTDGYKTHAKTWFTPLAKNIAEYFKQQNQPIVVGINGCQGSGKTTLADYLCTIIHHVYGINSIAISLDDFYYTKAERQALAQRVHPLLATRGVPGTHDINLAINTLEQLTTTEGSIAVPRFNKSIDDREQPEFWTQIETPVSIIILEGWCVGSRAAPEETLKIDVNRLETQFDPKSIWRNYVNQCLLNEYAKLFNKLDYLVMLKAPNFECVYEWRLEQEEKLSQKISQKLSRKSTTSKTQAIMKNIPATEIMDASAISQFIQHYQRITEHTLKTLPQYADECFVLDDKRHITGHQKKNRHRKRLIVFTDLDGTLLDHTTYSHRHADPIIEKMDKLDIPIIPTTSKTYAEIKALDIPYFQRTPVITENGAAIYIPCGYFKKQPADTILRNNEWMYSNVPPREHWLALLEKTLLEKTGRQLSDKPFTYFNQLSNAEIMAATGLSAAAAARANLREFSEPITWLGNTDEKKHFIEFLTQQGGYPQQGGRFLTLAGNCDKGKALQWLLQEYQRNEPECCFSSIALGDSHNDVPMLECADHAVIIRSPKHPPPPLKRTNNIMISNDYGDKGWAECISQHISNYLASK